MGEGKDAKAKVDEDARLADKRHCSHGLLHRYLRRKQDKAFEIHTTQKRYLCYWGEIVVGVVGHDYAAKKNRHDSTQV